MSAAQASVVTDTLSSKPSVPMVCSPWKRVAVLIERVFAVIGISVVLFHLTLMSSVIVSPSMSPTLQGQSWNDGDRVLTERVSYQFHQPRRWDVVTFRKPDGMILMKRAVGLPGERIQLLSSGELVVNGTPVPRPKWLEELKYIPIGNLHDGRVADCGNGYFVLGDDSRDSDDSRYEGTIAPSSILGRAWLIISPWTRLGWVR